MTLDRIKQWWIWLMGDDTVEPMTDTAASSSAAASVAAAGTATPLWSEEFTALNLAAGQLWYANPNFPAGQTGVKDPAGKAFDAHPNQKFSNGTVLNPFALAPVSDSSGAASDGNALTITCQNSTAAQQAACGYAAWGGTLVTNADIKQFTPGCYIEIRALFKGNGSGVWPAIWMYAAEGVKAGQTNASSFQGAEVDIVEPQGNITPGWVSLHMRESGDAPNPNYKVNGSSDINGPYGYPIVQNQWAVYGFDWQTTALDFYLNGVKVYTNNNATVLSYFNQSKMAFRLDYTLENNTIATPVSMSVDNIRQWASFAASRASGPTPPPPPAPVNPTVTTTALPGATVGVGYSTPLAATGGVTPYTWSTTGTLPAGLTLSPSGVISGTPSATAASATFGVTCTGSDTGKATKSLSIAVTTPPPPPPPPTPVTTLDISLPVDPTNAMTTSVEALLTARGFGASSLTNPLSAQLAAFQTAQSLPSTGTLDAPTWTALITG
jgi:beta-glucanase (GH16 family)